MSNACYAMRLKLVGSGDGYEPLLRVSSRLVGEVVEVRIWDNGTGIADDVIGHIFNPFFSTREGALGAGLGTSYCRRCSQTGGGRPIGEYR